MLRAPPTSDLQTWPPLEGTWCQKIFNREKVNTKKKEINLEITPILEQYLDHLEDHVHDIHAFVRSGVLQAWIKLCQAKAIPLTRQYKLLKLVVGRLQDKSSNVRKQAVQLLTGLLQCNPYNATLPVEELKESYKRELEKLSSMKPQPDRYGHYMTHFVASVSTQAPGHVRCDAL